MFIVDTMLGTLAKWLRILGFDTIYEAGMDDDEILRLAIAENRVIISRDVELCSRKSDSILLKSRDLDEQIARILDFYSVDKNKILSRCLECNCLLQMVIRQNIEKTSVPEDILQRYDVFWHCEKCNKYYWPGTHFENMKQKANHLLDN